MHEIRASVPAECIPEAVQLANSVGIDRVTVTDVFVHGPEMPAGVISVETSTPKARAFIEKFLNSPSLQNRNGLSHRASFARCSATPRQRILHFP